jgi:hypothetical protein
VLSLPVLFFILDLPPRTPSYDRRIDDGIPDLGFEVVWDAAHDAKSRAELDGKRTHLRGWFVSKEGDKTREFGLVRDDLEPSLVLIVRLQDDHESVSASEYRGRLVFVTGRVAFEEHRDRFETIIWMSQEDRIRAWSDPVRNGDLFKEP